MAPVLQVGGQWTMVQKNGFKVDLDVRQQGSRLSAHAVSDRGVHSREANGSVAGPDFELTIVWDGGARGHYTGKLKHGPFAPPPVGFLEGITQDLDNPSSRAEWQSEGAVFRFA